MDLRGPAQAVPARFGPRMFAALRARPIAVAAVAFGGLVALTLAIAIPRSIRRKLEEKAAAHGLVLTVGAVSPGIRTLTLRDVNVTPRSETGKAPWFQCHSDEIRVQLDGFRPVAIALNGGSVDVAGDVDFIKSELTKLRGSSEGDNGGARASAKGITVDAKGLAVTWDGGGDPLRALRATGVRGTHDGANDTVGWETLNLGKADDAVASVSAARGDLALVDRRLATATLEGVDVRVHLRAQPGDVAVPVVHTPERQVLKTAELPDASPLRERAMTVGSALAERLPADAVVRIAALRVHITDGDRSPLVIGPGPLQIARNPAGTTLSFIGADPGGDSARNTPGKTPLTARLELPSGGTPAGSDPKFHLEGGPVSLARLGIQEHALGLVDVEKATLAGTADVTLAPTGVAFDGRITVRDLGIDEPRLAPEVLHGLSLTVGGRGTQENRTRITLEAGTLAVGDTTVSLRGNLALATDLRGSRLTGDAVFDVPTTPCDGMLRSLPAGLLPTLKTARMSGTFTAHTTLAFDERDLDHLDLRWLIDDRCRLVDVPPELTRSHFSGAFSQRIYHRDGTLGDLETGPGTRHWASIEDISPYMQVAVLTTEDGGFFRHQGFHHAAIKAAVIANLKAHKFARGASTISMQLAKNLFLTRKKTLSRKLEELILTDYLEANFQKSEMMELYLNVIEFGPDIYGIKQASEHYFGREPSELNVAEAFFLATLLPSPIKHHAAKERGKLSDDALARLRALIKIAEKRGNLSKRELAEALGEPVIFHKDGEPCPEPRPRPSSTRFEGGADDEEVTPPPMPGDGEANPTN